MSPSLVRCLRPMGLLAVVLLASCGGGGAGSAPTTGGLQVRMHDRPMKEVEHVFVTIERVEVFRMVDEKEVHETISSVPGQYDLLELQNGIEAVLGDEQLQPGLYHSIRLIVSRDSKEDIRDLPADQLKNYVIAGDKPYALRVPSGEQTGIKLGRNFTIEAGGTTTLTLDFDVRRSVHRCGHRHIYRLRPRIRVVATHMEPAPGTDPAPGDPGTPAPLGLSGAISTSDGTGLPGDTEISVQQNGVEVATAGPDEFGMYSVEGLPDGSYDVVVIAPGYDYALETGIVVTDGSAAAAHDFMISQASGTGAVYGVVSPPSDDLTIRLIWNGVTVATVGGDPTTGEYLIDNVPAGDYTVEASNASNAVSAAASVSGGSGTQVDIGL